MSITIGSNCPEFTLLNQEGKEVNMRDFIGTKNIIIYFYPKDNTPGCTKEACSFRDSMHDLNNLDCEVFGISADSVSSHKAFSERFRLTFNLLSDENNLIRKQFKVPANLFGIFPGRVTYIINKEGKVIHIINSQTNPEKHIKETIEVVKGL
jgi:thioredoxin-dependent peroxiredoxin